MASVLTTPRLLLRNFGADDAARLPALCGAFEVSRVCMKVPHPYSEDDARFFLEHVCTAASSLTLAIVRREDDELMGCVSLDAIGDASASLGYWLGRPFWGHGYATEAAQAIVAHGFSSLGLERVHGRHFVENPASGAVMSKLGFVATGGTAMERCMARGGMELPTVLLCLTRTVGPGAIDEPTAAEPSRGTRRKTCRLCFSDAYVQGLVRQALEERGWQAGEEEEEEGAEEAAAQQGAGDKQSEAFMERMLTRMMQHVDRKLDVGFRQMRKEIMKKVQKTEGKKQRSNTKRSPTKEARRAKGFDFGMFNLDVDADREHAEVLDSDWVHTKLQPYIQVSPARVPHAAVPHVDSPSLSI